MTLNSSPEPFDDDLAGPAVRLDGWTRLSELTRTHCGRRGGLIGPETLLGFDPSYAAQDGAVGGYSQRLWRNLR